MIERVDLNSKKRKNVKDQKKNPTQTAPSSDDDEFMNFSRHSLSSFEGSGLVRLLENLKSERCLAS